MEIDREHRQESPMDKEDIYVADIYSDVHVFKKSIGHKSAEGLLNALKFLKQFKKSKDKQSKNKIDEIILNGDTIDHLGNRSAFDVWNYLNLDESKEKQKTIFQERNKKVNSEKIGELNTLIKAINEQYLEENSETQLREIQTDTYNIDIAADVFEKIIDEIKDGISKKSTVYVIGNHENRKALKKMGIIYQEGLIRQNLQIEHGQLYDGKFSKWFEDWGKKVRVEMNGFSTHVVEFIDKILGFAEYIANKVEAIGKKGVELFYRESKKPKNMRETEKYRVRGHLHKHVYDDVKKLLVTGAWYTEGPGRVISKRHKNGKYAAPLFINNSTYRKLEDDINERIKNSENPALLQQIYEGVKTQMKDYCLAFQT